MCIIQKFASIIYKIPVDGDSDTICWVFTVLLHLPRGRIKVPFLDMIVIIDSVHSDLSWPPSLVTVHYKYISSGFVVALRYSVFCGITPPIVMHANEYTIVPILKQFIYLSYFWDNCPILVIISISNLYYSLWVGRFGGVIMHNWTLSFQITTHRLEIQPFVTCTT